MKRSLKDFSQKRRMYGRMFILPWEIGFVIFFLIPLAQSLMFVFSNVTIGQSDFNTVWTGMDNINYIFNQSPKYVENLVDSLTSFTYSIPLVVALSLIVAVMLNQKFKGRVIFRSIFFLPVIIATGVVMNYIQGDAAAEALRSGGAEASSSGVNVTEILQGMNLSTEITDFLVGFVNQIFNLFWDCGVQIVLFISGLQSIPEQLYEVCKVEGANEWEKFWYVTFPMLSGTTLLVVVFTAIEIFTDSANLVMKQAYAAMQQQIYDRSAAMLWVYFALVGLILGVVVLLLQKKIFAKWAT
ncbi:MAG: sugar ABC transporter permease [Ruminococcaceae bacterium]|nr:sugar ABC transporter permease [Oscillospiraceae bacterium]